jgi:hypothetical protein
MGGVCWISPRNCESAASTFSRVTCRQGAVRTRAPSLSYESVSQPSKHVVLYSYQGFSFCEQKPAVNAHLCAIQEIVQFLGAFSNTDDCETLMLSVQHQELPTNYGPRTPLASGSSVPPCPIFTMSLLDLHLSLSSSLSSSTKRRERLISLFNWFTTCMDAGPDGFITPKRPDRGNEAAVLGMLEICESSHGRLSDLCIGR